MPPPWQLEEMPSRPSSPKDDEPPEPIIVDDEGDLRLRVGAEADGVEQEFLVCSVTLRRASPIWKRMLFGGFRESKPSQGDWVVSLPGDKAAPMKVFMDIIHTSFNDVPKKPKLSQLYEILITADKYYMWELIKPWMPEWSKAMASAQETEDGDSLAMLTHISWEFGDLDVYKIMISKLTLGCSIDEDGDLITADGTRLDEYERLGPPDLLETIMKQRILEIEKILHSFHKLTDRLIQKKVTHQYRHSEDECVYLTLGSIWFGVAKVWGSFLPKKPSVIPESVADLASSVADVLSNVKDKCDHTSELRQTIDVALTEEEFHRQIHTQFYIPIPQLKENRSRW